MSFKNVNKVIIAKLSLAWNEHGFKITLSMLH